MTRWVVPGAYFLLLGIVVAIHAADPAAGRHLLQGWMQHPYRYPFLDWQTISRTIQCWQHGVNVYVENPCPEPTPYRLWNYSPLWLRATFLPIGDQLVRPVGIGLTVLFGLAIASLPPLRRWYQCLILILACVSSAVVFGLERANMDVVIFLMTAAGVLLWQRSLPFHLLGYLVFLCAGLLKFYPVVLLVLCLRERLRLALAVGVAALAVMALFVIGYRDELAEAVRNIPSVWYFGDGFGARNLPFGLATVLNRAAAAVGWQNGPLLHILNLLLKNAGLPCLVAATFVYALWLSGKAGVKQAMAGLPASYLGPLVAGSVLIAGCFLSGRSIGYRAIFLILTLPGLLTLARTLPSAAGRRLTLGTCLAMLFVMWMLAIQATLVAVGLSSSDLLDADPAGLVHWFAQQLAWWWITGMLLAVLVSFGLNSATFLDLKALFSPQAGRLGRQPPGD